MSFNKFDTVDQLDDSKNNWEIRVRAQAIWKGVSREKNEFCGYNLIFVDDCVSHLTLCTPIIRYMFLFLPIV